MMDLRDLGKRILGLLPYVRELKDEAARAKSGRESALADLASLRQDNDQLRSSNTELEDFLRLQREAVGHAKVVAAHALRDYATATKLMIAQAAERVRLGYNPLEFGVENPKKGHYALLDRHGKIIAVSHKVRRIFGYEPGQIVDYSAMIAQGQISNEPRHQHFDFLRVRLAEGETTLSNVDVRPLVEGEIYAGSCVSFNRLGLVDKIRKGKITDNVPYIVKVRSAVQYARDKIAQLSRGKPRLA